MRKTEIDWVRFHWLSQNISKYVSYDRNSIRPHRTTHKTVPYSFCTQNTTKKNPNWICMYWVVHCKRICIIDFLHGDELGGAVAVTRFQLLCASCRYVSILAIDKHQIRLSVSLTCDRFDERVVIAATFFLPYLAVQYSHITLPWMCLHVWRKGELIIIDPTRRLLETRRGSGSDNISISTFCAQRLPGDAIHQQKILGIFQCFGSISIPFTRYRFRFPQFNVHAHLLISLSLLNLLALPVYLSLSFTPARILQIFSIKTFHTCIVSHDHLSHITVENFCSQNLNFNVSTIKSVFGKSVQTLEIIMA